MAGVVEGEEPGLGRGIGLRETLQTKRDRLYTSGLRLSKALCVALTQSDCLSCLGSSVVKHLPSYRCVTGLSPA